MSTDVTTPAHDPTHLPDDAGVLKQMVAELLATVAQLRTTIDKQQAHIQYLVRRTFGRRTERAEGPTLFDLSAPPEEAVSAPPPDVPSPQIDGKRRGHGRRPRRADMPREREVLDLTEAEKTCPGCGEVRVRIGADVSERLDYRPACLFVRVLERPTYICRRCEQKGDNIQAAQRPLPPEPIPRGTVGAGLLAHVLVSKWWGHLPLYRLEGILARLGWEVSRSRPCATR
jgi:transposase